MKEHSYTKAAGISLFVHAVLAGVLIISYCLITPPSATPIEVEFIMVGVANVGDSLNEVSSLSTAELQTKTTGQQTDSKEDAEQRTSEPQKSSQQAKASNQKPLPTTIREAATAGVRKVASGDMYETPDHSPTNNLRFWSQPGYISGPRPAYPQDARRAGQEGAVIIRVLVGTDGSAADVAVFASSGYESLDQAAVRAVKKWRFSPARNDSTAVESYYDVRIKFRLADWQ